EHMKRYTTLGMATDQGKTGGVQGLGVLAEALGRGIPETGITTFRPPYTPVPIAALAGRTRGAHWHSTRLTPMHDALAAEGARFTDAGLWKRGWFFPVGAEDIGAAYVREAKMVRETCGIVDVSTLGKIDVLEPHEPQRLARDVTLGQYPADRGPRARPRDRDARPPVGRGRHAHAQPGPAPGEQI
ncbi:MAG: hypothetical protein AAFW46_19275, partial [Pseudomonadota bacterium]